MGSLFMLTAALSHPKTSSESAIKCIKFEDLNFVSSEKRQKAMNHDILSESARHADSISADFGTCSKCLQHIVEHSSFSCRGERRKVLVAAQRLIVSAGNLNIEITGFITSSMLLSQVALLAAIVVLQQVASVSCQCHAQWVVADRFRNTGTHSVAPHLNITLGLIDNLETSNGRSRARILKRISSVSVNFKYSWVLTPEVSELRGKELTESQRCLVMVPVPPGYELILWHLVANYEGIRFGFYAFEPLSHTERPIFDGITCRVEVVAAQINDSTLVRLRNEETGQYLNSHVVKDGWQSATLGNSLESHFRLYRHRDGVHVRIVTQNPLWSKFKYAYCANNGGIYFDEDKLWMWMNEKQLWNMSITNPVDGDAVTFRNKYWPTAGLDYSGGVICPNSQNLDRWIIEVVK